MNTDTAEYILDEITRGVIAEYNAQIQTLAGQMNGALRLVVKQQKLPGEWRLAPDGTRLIRIDTPEPQNGTPDFTKKNPNGNGTRKHR